MKTLSYTGIMLTCCVFSVYAQTPGNPPTTTTTTTTTTTSTGCATPPSTFGNVWYIDPVHGATKAAGGNGSQAHPWNSLEAVFVTTTGYTYPLLTTAPYKYWPAGAAGYEFTTGPGAGPIKPGDEILLMSGNYGNIGVGNYLNELSLPSFLTIAAAPGQTPVLTALSIVSTNMLQFIGLKVQSLAPATLSGAYLVEVKDQGASYPTSNIVFNNMTISSQDDISGWTQAQWIANGRNGFGAGIGAAAAADNTKCISMSGSHITNVRFGAFLGAGSLVFSGNQIDHFGDDALDYATNNLTITKNYIHDAINVGDGNHPDAMQGVIGLLPAGVATNTYENILIDSNTVIRQVDPNLPFPNLLQGIDAFNSDWENVTVTNNVVITSACYGISYQGLQNGLIANNTVLMDGLIATPGGCKPQVSVGAGSTNVAVRNNLANSIAVDNRQAGVEADHNLGLSTANPTFFWYVNGAAQYYGNPGTYLNSNIIAAGGTAAEFGATNFDPTLYEYSVMLLSNAPAIGVGATASGPSVDILGVTRTTPTSPAGAYGYPQ
jgi:Right handed beta helix region